MKIKAGNTTEDLVGGAVIFESAAPTNQQTIQLLSEDDLDLLLDASDALRGTNICANLIADALCDLIRRMQK